jgi:hypothetical protein
MENTNLPCRRAHQRTFQILDQPIKTVTSFNYLGRIITSQDNDWTAARNNLQKARQIWALISRILMHENASPQISALFYKATKQNSLQTENTTRRIFWWNQSLADSLQLTQGNVHELE